MALQHEFAEFEGEGTVFGSISKSNFEQIKVIIPPPELIRQLENIVNPLDEVIRNNYIQSQSLSRTRDTLLPKLISGEIRVEQAEQVLEAVV